MNKENCALKLVDEIILYYDARSKKHQITVYCNFFQAKLHDQSLCGSVEIDCLINNSTK